MILDHAPVPTNGPRCLRCGRWVADHAGWFRRWRWRRQQAHDELLRRLEEAKRDRDIWRQRWRDNKKP